MQETVYGAFVRSYAFNYDGVSDVAHGKMWVDFITMKHVEFDVSMVIIGSDDRAADTAAKIVARTAKFSDLSDLVLDAHFCTHAQSIDKHIVVYEQFSRPFFDRDANAPQDLVGPFFMDNEGIDNNPATKFRLTPFWVEKMR